MSWRVSVYKERTGNSSRAAERSRDLKEKGVNLGGSRKSEPRATRHLCKAGIVRAERQLARLELEMEKSWHSYDGDDQRMRAAGRWHRRQGWRTVIAAPSKAIVRTIVAQAPARNNNGSTAEYECLDYKYGVFSINVLYDAVTH